MINTKVIVLLSVFGLFRLSVFSQMVHTINLGEIPQRKVRQYIASRSIDQMNDFSAIHASWKKDVNVSDFKVLKKTFYLKNKLSDVWDCYRYSNPIRMWNGKTVRFGLLISKPANSVVYANNKTIAEIDTGQVYFLDLKLLKGLFNVPVAIEIITIDWEKKIMEFSYIDNNKSLGKQTLHFFDTVDSGTRLVHQSYFKSESHFRDNLLYPYFHNRFIKEFHRNMRQLIDSRKPSSPIII